MRQDGKIVVEGGCIRWTLDQSDDNSEPRLKIEVEGDPVLSRDEALVFVNSLANQLQSAAMDQQLEMTEQARDMLQGGFGT